MASTSRFIYEIKAEYAGKTALEQLQAGLEKLGKIDAFRKQERRTRRGLRSG